MKLSTSFQFSLLAALLLGASSTLALPPSVHRRAFTPPTQGGAARSPSSASGSSGVGASRGSTLAAGITPPTVIVPAHSQAWCGLILGTKPKPGTKEQSLPLNAVQHPGAVKFDEAMLRAVLTVAATMQVQKQKIRTPRTDYPRTFINVDTTGSQGKMIPDGPGELWEFPIMPDGTAPNILVGNNSPMQAGDQGPFRILYSVQAGNPQVFTYHGVTEHPKSATGETILCPRFKPANPKGTPRNNPNDKPTKQQNIAAKKKAEQAATQSANTGNWKNNLNLKQGEAAPKPLKGKKKATDEEEEPRR